MLSPKKTKYRKQQRRIKKLLLGDATRTNTLAFGDFGLITKGEGMLTDRQIEAARIALTRTIRRGGKVWIRVFPDYPYSKKPAETRMGKGKGSLDCWCAPVKRGTVIFELTGVSRDLAELAVRRAAAKLPMAARFLERD